MLVAGLPLALAQHTAAPASTGAASPPPTPEAPADPRPLSEDQLRDASPEARSFHAHVAFLADPKLEGRYAGTPGNRAAADYIERQFTSSGLMPLAPQAASEGKTSFRQAFRCGEDTKVVEQRVTLLGPMGKPHDLRPGEEFTVLGLSGNGKVEAPLVFVGYSINEGSDGYTSIPKDAGLAGKIALLFRFEPMDEHGKSLWTKGNGWSPSASLDDKVQTAVASGAAGVIIVNPPGVDDARGKSLVSTRDSLPLKKDMGVPVVMVTPEAVAPLLSGATDELGAPLSFESLRARADRPDLRSALLDLAPHRPVTLQVAISREPLMTDNVWGVLPGRGELASQWIVIGAHYDHVGVGPVGVTPANLGKIHPGADDNASGSAGLMLLASSLARAYANADKNTPARSILFVAFSAEESGLNGSHHLVNNPPIPLESIDLMINMDMIGRLRKDVLEIDGTESAQGLYDMLKPRLDASGLDIKHGANIATNSDHHSFYTKSIPVLFFFTGLHREYHTPQDTIDTINPVGGARVAALIHDIALDAATRSARLAFVKPTKEQEQASKPGPTRTRVRFGIAPGSYADDKPGVEVGDVYEGTPAAEGGVKVGDRLIKWNGQPIRRVEDWMPMLGSANPGDVVSIIVLRNGEEVVLKVTLKARDSGGK